MDRVARMGLAGKYSNVYTLSPAGQVELAKRRRGRSGWYCLQSGLSSATSSTFVACSDHRARSHHLRFSQLGRRASLPTLEVEASQKVIVLLEPLIFQPTRSH